MRGRPLGTRRGCQGARDGWRGAEAVVCREHGSLVRPAAVAALVLALVPVAARADTSNIVFPVAGPVVTWHDDYGTKIAGAPQRGNAIGVAAGTPVVATASGRVTMLWRGSGGWSITLTTADGQSVRLPAPGPRRQPQDRLRCPGSRTEPRVKHAQRLGWSGFSGAASATAPQLGFQYLPGGGAAGRPLRTARQRAPAARRGAAGARRAGQAAADRRRDLERARRHGRARCACARPPSSVTAAREASSSRSCSRSPTTPRSRARRQGRRGGARPGPARDGLGHGAQGRLARREPRAHRALGAQLPTKRAGASR